MKATKYQQKSQIRLEDLLRRRKTTLNQFMKDRGITTYEGLDGVCKRLGVLTPNQGSFIECVGHYVSNPTAGVVVVHPSVVIVESTGNPELDVEDRFEDLQPQISVTDESGENEVSVVLQEAMVTVGKPLSKKQRKRIKKQQDGFEVKGEV
jgi:hypothetical protein